MALQEWEDPDTGPTELYIPLEVPLSLPALSRGSPDKVAVYELQKALNRNGEHLSLDGDFGAGTEKALVEFQTSYGIPRTGVADDATMDILDRQAFGADPQNKSLPLPAGDLVPNNSGVGKAWNAYGSLLASLSGVLGFTPAVACAVLAVESAGEGFWNGQMVIRFENHVFRTQWGKVHPAVFDAHFKTNPTEVWKDHQWRPDTGVWRTLHTAAAGQSEERAVLAYARSLDDEAALNSISMGAPQIMGFNHTKVGFPTARAMFDAFSADARAHVLGLFDFIRSDHHMVRALRAGDWVGFARIYNGPGQADIYGGRIRDNVLAARKLGIK